MAAETYRYSRRRPANRDLRASDADRTAVGDILRREHVDGRLDSDEYAERYGRCLEAKTYAQLDSLIADLPAAPEPAFQAGPGPVPSPTWSGTQWDAGRPRRWRMPAVAWIGMLIALIALSGGHLAWFVVPFIFFFLVLRPLMWHSACRSGCRGPGWGRRGGSGPGSYGNWM
jgi:Domain of unknown function (DUF1707)